MAGQAIVFVKLAMRCQPRFEPRLLGSRSTCRPGVFEMMAADGLQRRIDKNELGHLAPRWLPCRRGILAERRNFAKSG